ncbi:18619_t:CDS:2, partial [Racocetra fulgida]
DDIETRSEDEEGMLNSVRGINGIIRDEVDSGIPSNRIVVVVTFHLGARSIG